MIPASDFHSCNRLRRDGSHSEFSSLLTDSCNWFAFEQKTGRLTVARTKRHAHRRDGEPTKETKRIRIGTAGIQKPRKIRCFVVLFPNVSLHQRDICSKRVAHGELKIVQRTRCTRGFTENTERFASLCFFSLPVIRGVFNAWATLTDVSVSNPHIRGPSATPHDYTRTPNISLQNSLCLWLTRHAG